MASKTGPVHDTASATLRTLSDFFTRNDYVIPTYQRDYAWRATQVKDLLSDLWEFSNSDDAYYVLGQVITAPTPRHAVALVDGQQRITTIYLIFLALHRHMAQLSSAEDKVAPATQAFNQNVENLLWTWGGKPLRMQPRFDGALNGIQTMDALVRDLPLPEAQSVSDKNLRRNFEQIQNWLKTEQKYLQTVDGVWAFTEKLMSQVQVVTLELTTENQAIDFFIKLNSRGVKLNAADLLKGLLLKHATDSEYEFADAAWQAAGKQVGVVIPSGAASMEFLLGAMIRKRLGQRVGKEQLYSQWEKQLRSRAGRFEPAPKGKATNRKITVTEFVDQLTTNALALSLIGTGKTPHGNEAVLLRGTKLFKSYQHYNVLLAGSALSEKNYEELCRAVEARTILQLFSDEPSQEYEKILPSWARRIGDLEHLDSTVTLADVREACRPAFENVDALLERVDPVIRRLRYEDVDGRSRQRDVQRIRYVLARTNLRADIKAGFKNEYTLQQYLETVDGRDSIPLDIDHIQPKSKAQSWNVDGGPDLVNSIGNLALLWKKRNIQASNNEPAFKEDAFKYPHLILTWSLTASSNENADKLAKKYWDMAPVDLNNWNAESVKLRTDLYAKLFVEDLFESVKPFV